MIRHLHDLCALNAVIEEERHRSLKQRSSFDEDQKTGKRVTDKALYPSLQSALRNYGMTRFTGKEYQRFVDAMSYADDKDTISFNRAVDGLEALIALFKI